MRGSDLASACILVSALGGCAIGTQLVADSGDLADYRAYRVAADVGPRLARAQRYLAAHPRGAWSPEVRSAFDDEEPRYFELAKQSKQKAIEYLVDLPRGPHAEAARALVVAFDAHTDDITTLVLLADARRTDAMLEIASRERRRVTERILEDVGLLLDPETYGARIDDAPPALARTLGGTARRTFGPAPTRRDDTLGFTLPTREGSEVHLASVELAVKVDAGLIAEGIVWGPDLFVRWTEADLIRVIDPTLPESRALAAAHVVEVVSGAFEAALPAARCSSPKAADEILARRCDGWSASVKMGAHAGAPDVIFVRGSRR
jgi:hypothetical protein